MDFLLFSLIIIVIIINIWNGYSTHKMANRPLRSNEINDKKYWELKYKMQYMVTVFTVIISVAGYLGYNSLTNIEEKISTQFKNSVDSLKEQSLALQEQYESLARISLITDSSLGAAERRILGLGSRNDLLNRALKISSDSLERLKNNIELINERNKIQQNVYIVDNVDIGDPKDDGTWPKIYFKDLTTIVGQKLPVFKKKPIVTVVSMNGSDASVKNVTTESFEILSMMSTIEMGKYIYTIFITERP